MTASPTPAKPKANALENILAASALVAVVVMVLDWFDVALVDGWGATGMVSLLSVGILLLMAEGVRTGELRGRGGTILRKDNPTAFSTMRVFYGVLALALGMAAIFMHRIGETVGR